MKDIPGYEGRYAATKDGKIWSHAKPCSSKKGKFMKLQLSTNRKNRNKPYEQYTVGLYKDKGRITHLVHRLIALTFIPNPENKPQINHKDCDPLSNSITNLEWATHQENMDHAVKNNLIDSHSGNQDITRTANGKKTGAINGMKSRRMFTMEEADCIRKIYKVTKKSYRSIARAYNCTANTIIKICNCKSYVQEAQHDRIKNISSYPTVKTRG